MATKDLKEGAPAAPLSGDVLRHWRLGRRLSQLTLATEAEISARHLSFLETGRAHPSREMVLLLAGVLDVPLREQNALLAAAGSRRSIARQRWRRRSSAGCVAHSA
ncbi:MAG: helix-turn-helix domain-containing protein [Candidatus Rokuibacteriota bacterium]